MYLSNQVNDLAIVDPTFNAGDNYLDVLKSLGGFKGKISLQSRFEMVKDEYIQACQRLQEGGAKVVLEVGIQTIHRQETKMIHRPNNLLKIKEWAAKLRENDIPFEISLIYGLPVQTLQSFKENVAFAQDLGPTKLVAWPLMLLRGTELERQKDVYGLNEEVRRF